MHLVILPTCKNNYPFGFSAPLAWLIKPEFTKEVHGVYAFQLTRDLVRQYDSFVIELNWFLELHEFILVVEYIKTNNTDAKILMGGLYAALAWEQIFATCNVDFFIQGDNELPMEQYLKGAQPKDIPNFTGRDFRNPLDYRFSARDFLTLEFNLEWFPEYFRRQKDAAKDSDIQLYSLPMIITSKGACSIPHQGCDYCMGSKHPELRKIFGRGPVIMDREAFIRLAQQAGSKYGSYSIYVLSAPLYDLTGLHLPGHPFIEIDCPVDPQSLKKFVYAFDECHALIPIYEEGIMGKAISDHAPLLEIADSKHTISFAAYQRDQGLLKSLPEKSVIFNLEKIFAPPWAHWDVYTNFDMAMKNSRTYYDFCRKRNVHPLFAIP